ncbi:transcription termination factor MTEF1, chloroplastic-like isoform X2 [Lotus japonicus]|nr:transcription termination factor MTEF1, chloroplastic-like isoform X2 [Lotus japonicus]
MFHCHRVRALFNLNPISHLSSSSPTSKCSHSLQPISHKIFFSTTSEPDQQQSFTITYLTKHCGFSPQAALKASKRVRFNTAQKPDSVIAFFREQGFSPSQVQSVITSAPDLLTCDPIKRVLPKLQFLASKGASTHDIVTTVTRSPLFLRSSFEKQ